MTITITRKDWKPGLNYYDPCGCLLHRAISRSTRKRNFVYLGFVRVAGRFREYNQLRHEARLQAAHRDPSLLPITITLR